MNRSGGSLPLLAEAMPDSPRPPAAALLEHSQFVRAVARAALGGDDLVDDVVQQTWVAALEGGAARARRLGPWLGGVAWRQAKNLLRQRSAQRRREMKAARLKAQPSAAEAVERAETGRRLVTAVLSLEEPYRTALLLRYLDDLPPMEVARRMSVPVETARTRVRRGLAKLRQILADDAERHGQSAPLLLVPLVSGPHVHGPTAATVALAGGLAVKKVFALVALVLLVLAGKLALDGVGRGVAPREGGQATVGMAPTTSAPELAGRHADTAAPTSPSDTQPPTPARESGPAARVILRLRMPDGSQPERAVVMVTSAPAEGGSGYGHGIGLGFAWTAESPSVTLPLGKWLVGARVTDGGLWQSTSQAVELTASADSSELDLDLGLVTCLRGRITWPDGEGDWVSGVHLVALGEEDASAHAGGLASSSVRAPIEGRSADEGTFVFEAVTPGRHLLGVRRTSGDIVMSREVFIPREGTTLDVVVPAARPSEYTVVYVVDPEGGPVNEASFRLLWEGPSGGGDETAIALATAEPGGAAAGVWRLLRPQSASSRDGRTEWVVEVRSPTFGIKRSAYNPVTDQALRIQYDSDPCWLEVQVSGVVEGKYASRLSAALAMRGSPARSGATALDARGVASLGPVQPGDFDVHLLLDNRVLLRHPLALAPGKSNLRLSLPPLYEVTLEGVEGMVLVTPVGTDRGWRLTKGPAKDGQLQIDGLPGGEYRAQSGGKSVVFQRPGPDLVRME